MAGIENPSGCNVVPTDCCGNPIPDALTATVQVSVKCCAGAPASFDVSLILQTVQFGPDGFEEAEWSSGRFDFQMDNEEDECHCVDENNVVMGLKCAGSWFLTFGCHEADPSQENCDPLNLVWIVPPTCWSAASDDVIVTVTG